MSQLIYQNKANGKLLITSEYFVLDGAESLALPTKFGQTLEVTESNHFHWTSKDELGHIWIEIQDIDNIEDKNTILLVEILKYIGIDRMNGNFCIHADFHKDWGLGSSSTLIALLADYFKLNPYELNQKFFHGSGYDIACAFSEHPITYKLEEPLKPSIMRTSILNSLQLNMYFLYLDKKQNSRSAIALYNQKKINKKNIANDLSQITKALLEKHEIDEWIYLLNIHEDIISKSLLLEKVSQTVLRELPYFSKSLGAWGGDFVMILTDDNPQEVKKNIQKLGFDTIFTYSEIIKS